MLSCRADLAALLEYSNHVVILPVMWFMADRKGQVFVDDRGCDYRADVMGLGGQRARSRSTRYLQISRWQFGADSLIILKFIALCVEMVHFFCSQPLILL